MCVECQDTPVQGFGLAEQTGFLDEPAEKRHHALVLIQDETFGMPLHTQHGFVLGTFDGFYDAVGGEG